MRNKIGVHNRSELVKKHNRAYGTTISAGCSCERCVKYNIKVIKKK